jgi:hypothetical protein
VALNGRWWHLVGQLGDRCEREQRVADQRMSDAERAPCEVLCKGSAVDPQ